MERISTRTVFVFVSQFWILRNSTQNKNFLLEKGLSRQFICLAFILSAQKTKGARDLG